MWKINFMFLCIILIASCELNEEIKYDTYYEGDKIVIHGYISLNDGVKICVKSSVPPNQIKREDKISNVTLYLLENNIIIDTLSPIDEYYYTLSKPFSPKVDAYYHIEAISSTLPKVISEQQKIPLPVEFDTLYIKIEELTNYARLIGSYRKKQNEIGYYLKLYSFYEGKTDSFLSGSELFSPYGIIEDISNDRCSIDSYIGHTSEFDSVKVILYTLSSDFTKFLKSIQYYESSRDDPFYEYTYPVFSNIKGGYGIFGSYSYAKKYILTKNNDKP